jgi:serine/threonine-protein kinase
MIARILKIAALCAAILFVAGASAYLTLTLIIKSEDTVIVPELVGKDVVSALELLTDLELNTKVKGSEYSPDFPKNHVIFQDPEPGAEIKKDRDVKIVLSRGSRIILIPNLNALSMQQARMVLEENGLSQGQITRTYHPAIEKGHIIAQIPTSGSMLNRGSAVDLLVSLGERPRAFIMPDLSGLSLDKAVFLAEETNLVVGEITSRFEKNKPYNLILEQNPLAGHRVLDGTAVHMVLNRPPEQTVSRHYNPNLYGSLLQYRLKSGFLRKRIRIEIDNRNATSEVFDDFVKPGDEVWVLIPGDPNTTTVFIYEEDKLVNAQLYEML